MNIVSFESVPLCEAGNEAGGCPAAAERLALAIRSGCLAAIVHASREIERLHASRGNVISFEAARRERGRNRW